MNELVLIVLLLGSLFTISALLIWVERRLLGHWQERYGPNRVGPGGILQSAADAIKLLAKEDWTPPFADKPVFVLAPAFGTFKKKSGFWSVEDSRIFGGSRLRIISKKRAVRYQRCAFNLAEGGETIGRFRGSHC